MSSEHQRGLRIVATIEAVKGLLVLLVGVGLPPLLHHHAHNIVVRLVGHFHLNPAASIPHVFLRLAEDFDNTRLWQLAGFAAGYAVIRFVEAYGLYHQRRWAEWLGCLGAGIYVPFEIAHLVRHPDVVGAVVLLTNLALVGYLGFVLASQRTQPWRAGSSG